MEGRCQIAGSLELRWGHNSFPLGNTGLKIEFVLTNSEGTIFYQYSNYTQTNAQENIQLSQVFPFIYMYDGPPTTMKLNLLATGNAADQWAISAYGTLSATVLPDNI